MSNPFTKRTRSKAVVTAANIAIKMQEEGYDNRTLAELLKRLEHTMRPEDFKEVK